MRGVRRLGPAFAFAIAFVFLSGAGRAGEPSGEAGTAGPSIDFATYIPTGRATRIPPSEAPIIDGALTDEVWAKAEPIDRFYQIEPDTGQPGSERTILRFLYDQNNLYIGIYAYDRQPDAIRATIKTRDGQIGSEDTVQIYLDPLNTRRNSYFFAMNALGARVDALIQNNSDYLREWSTIWTGRAMIVADGYTVEMAIPFRDLAYDPTKPDWVLEFARSIRRRGERIRWGGIDAATYFADISRSGTLTGISGIDTGLGLDIQLFGSVRYRHNWQTPKQDILSFRASGNAFYRLAPQLTGTLTVNPDFSDSPLDELQVNTTRFALFQPETRNFFLQDASTFEFGGHGFSVNNNYPYAADNGRPFFSRNIGLVNGLPASIIGGVKLSGEYAGLGIGALSVATNGTGDTKRSQILSVARVTKPIGESKLGVMFTNGDPTGHSDNTLFGADFQYRDSNFLPGKILQSDFYYQRTTSSSVGGDDSFGVSLFLPNEPWGGELHIKQIGTNFFPALGFANRTGIRQYDGRAQYRNRKLGWRWLDAGTQWYAVTGLNNHLQSGEFGLYSGIALRTTDEIYSRILYDYEDVPAQFLIAGKVPVPAGQYRWVNVNPYFRTNEGRPVYFRGDIVCCTYYNGDYLKIDLQADWRPGATFQFQPRYIYTYVNLPTGLVNIHQISANFIVNFSPDMQLYNQVQYDNISQKFALSVRYRWEYEPGQELFASIGQSAVIPGEPTFVPQSTQATIRLGHTFRF